MAQRFVWIATALVGLATVPTASASLVQLHGDNPCEVLDPYIAETKEFDTKRNFSGGVDHGLVLSPTDGDFAFFRYLGQSGAKYKYEITGYLDLVCTLLDEVYKLLLPPLKEAGLWTDEIAAQFP